jgi:nucleoside phosphorylase
MAIRTFPDVGDGALPQSQKLPSGTGGDVARSPIIAVTGLKMVSGGGDVVRALAVAVANKSSAIINFGVAGGLKPGLAPGSKLVARSVITEDGGRYHGDPVWSQRLSLVLGGATIADIVGIDAPVVGHADKHALHVKTGAHAADMESHIAARIAAAHKLPFAAFRVVADPAYHRRHGVAAWHEARLCGGARASLLISLLKSFAQSWSATSPSS